MCKKITNIVFFFNLGVLLALSGCATLDKDVIQPVAQKPVVSKTIKDQPKGRMHQGLKRKVAIARFSNETKYGQSFFLDANNDRIGKQCVDILSAKLMETGKFLLLERADLDKIQKELSIGDADKITNMADYLIVGSVSEFGRKDQSEVGIFSRVKKQTAFAKVHIRLLDTRTGLVIYSEDGEGEAYSEAGSIFGVGEKAGYDSTLNDKALEAAINNLSSNIIENLLNKPWRAYVLGYEDGLFIISGGKSQDIKPGMEFIVEREGKKVKNPQTNMYITLPGQVVGEIRVEHCVGDNVENEVSFCSIKKGDFSKQIQNKEFTELYIKEK